MNTNATFGYVTVSGEKKPFGSVGPFVFLSKTENEEVKLRRQSRLEKRTKEKAQHSSVFEALKEAFLGGERDIARRMP